MIGVSALTQPRRVSWMHIWSVAERREIRRPGSTARSPLISLSWTEDVCFQWSDLGHRLGQGPVTLRHPDPQNDRFAGFSPISTRLTSKQTLAAEPSGAWIWVSPRAGRARWAVLWSVPRSHTLSGRPIPRREAEPSPGTSEFGLTESGSLPLAGGCRSTRGDHYLLGPFSPMAASSQPPASSRTDRPRSRSRHGPGGTPIRGAPRGGQRRRLHTRWPLGDLRQRGRYWAGLGPLRPDGPADRRPAQQGRRAESPVGRIGRR